MRVTRLLVLCIIAAAASAPIRSQPRTVYDLLIRNGRVLDGTVNPWQAADIAVRGNRITAVGRIEGASAARTIDVAGLTVAAGFVDVHSHATAGLAGALNE